MSRSEEASPEGDLAAERKLLARLRGGEEAAFAELVKRHGGRMLTVAQRMLRHHEDARDAVQEAFLSAFRALDRFEGNARLSTWLHRIVVNAALMKLRTQRRKPEASIDELLPTFLEDGHAAEPSTPWREGSDETLSRRETRDLVRRSIDRLPESYRTILILRDVEELDTEETASLLGVSVNAAKTRLHRARQALRAILDPHFRAGGPS
ncbi:MAG TPA: sigma-70 family RNA polymerase sigma factor [Myxococcota bacterium]|jgi:RNA polymerase sigma-70 factor (ECF subfamily)|nr:sigma-70 family RNA polymerase sigma factor [Myxococcota bacterium]